MYQRSYCQTYRNVTVCQNDSIMTLYCVKVGSQSYLAVTNLFPLHICRPNYYTAEI